MSKTKFSPEIMEMKLVDLVKMLDVYNETRSGSCIISLWSDGSCEISDPMISGRKQDQVIFGADTLDELIKELKEG